ncbi:hypothetical protein [Tahibacter harae]|uniref:Uncharacterized protein n=1 Tax=Tahibacter harae TaxID=2963937 RepID=A0ABT1QUD2_9GAMM|nr:hypothetical protein [Tahibacter harae]MCQ4165900.1 hypothetical protein [Tahibacter harae]
MRVFWVLLSLAGLTLAILTYSPGLMALGLGIAFIGMFCAVFAFAAARIEATSRPDSALLTPEVLAQVRARAQQQQQQSQQQRAAGAPGQVPPPVRQRTPD